MKNSDLIRSMTDEELAGWLERIRLCCSTESEIREHNGKRYRHCYSCHFEFEEA